MRAERSGSAGPLGPLNQGLVQTPRPNAQLNPTGGTIQGRVKDGIHHPPSDTCAAHKIEALATGNEGERSTKHQARATTAAP